MALRPALTFYTEYEASGIKYLFVLLLVVLVFAEKNWKDQQCKLQKSSEQLVLER